MAVGGPGGVPQEVEEAESQNVEVALNIRPLIAQEQIEGCGECISVIPGEPQVCSFLNLLPHSSNFPVVRNARTVTPCHLHC
jgi:hypothetical protein